MQSELNAKQKNRLWKILKIFCVIVLAVVLISVGAFLIWAKTGVMTAEPGPLTQVKNDTQISWSEDGNKIVMRPADAALANTNKQTGVLFYPGAKVEPAAYAARLADLVTKDGMIVVIAKPILGLGIVDLRGPETYTGAIDGIDSWIVGGHSLGGVRACQVATKDQGLLLMASYCVADVKDKSLVTASLSGESDGLATPEKVAKYRPNLAESAEMKQIPGANHAAFGDYGPQEGDGKSNITDQEMNDIVRESVERISDHLQKSAK